MPANRPSPLVRREALDGAYVLLTFRHPEVAAEARAGQFVMIKAGPPSDLPLRRPFSIMTADPREETFTLFLKQVGPGTRALAALAPGELASCLGPLGRPFTAPPADTEALLVAGGYGVAPFRLFGEELSREGRRARLFYGGRTAADLQLRDRFHDLPLSVVLATEDGTAGVRGRVTVPLESYLDLSPGAAVRLHACGPDAMMHAVARVAEARDLPVQVSLDPWMGCGIGTCLGCVVPVQKPEEARAKLRCACTEGPVFDAATVVWPSERESRAHRAAALAEKRA
jgi:dihydroorotate dehydrogenase electron transfer subunit